MMGVSGEHSPDVFHGRLCHLYFVLEFNKATGKAGSTSRLMSTTPKRASMSTSKQASTSSTPKQKQATASSSNFFASSPSISSKQGTSSSSAKNSLQVTDTGMAVFFYFLLLLFPLIHMVQSPSTMGGSVSLMFLKTLLNFLPTSVDTMMTFRNTVLRLWLIRLTCPRKDQPTFNLRIKYAVVLYEPVVEVTADDD
jgi:hypothetical protein